MNLSRLVCATGFVLLCTQLNATTWEYRKCAIDAVFSGVNVPATSIPGSSFVGWARAQSGTVSAKTINTLSAKCLSWALSRDAGQIPNGCENNPRLLNNSEKRGKGDECNRKVRLIICAVSVGRPSQHMNIWLPETALRIQATLIFVASRQISRAD